MKIGEPSVSSMGTQVIVSLRTMVKSETIRRITFGHCEWPMFKAMADTIADEKSIKGRFVSADVRPLLGGLEVQLSWRNQ